VHINAHHVAQIPAVLSALLSLAGCRDETPRPAPPQQTPGASSGSASAPSAGRCGTRPEIVVDTICGAAIACDEGALPIALRDDGGDWPSLGQRCLGTLHTVVDALAKIGAPAEPQYGLLGPMDTTESCVRPGVGEQAKAATTILTRVRREGRARAGSSIAREELERFDFREMRASCAAQGYLLELSSDTGAPGAIGYHGIWRVIDGKPIVIHELHDTQVRSRIWPAGDLDGDGTAELLLRTPIGEQEGEDPIVFHARYDVISVAVAVPIEVAARVRVEQPTDGEERLVPAVSSVALPSGGVVVIDGQPHRLQAKAMVAMPTLRPELDAVLAGPVRLRQELLAPPPKGWSDGPPCDNATRRAWAQRAAPILGRALGAADAVVPLAGLWACSDAWRL
jgi:hypothetical protein